MWPDDLEESRERLGSDLHALTILRAFSLAADMPRDLPFGSFVGFSRFNGTVAAAQLVVQCLCPRTRQSTPRRGGRSYDRSAPYQRMNWLSTAVQSKWPLAGRAQSARKLMGSSSAT